MKIKLLSFILIINLCLVLNGCDYFPWVSNDMQLSRQTMTKWESSDGKYTVYLIEDFSGVMVCNFSDRQVAYNLKFFAPLKIAIFDTHSKYSGPSIDNYTVTDGYICRVGEFSYYQESQNEFYINNYKCNKIYTDDFPETKIVFKRMGSNITPDDIPRFNDLNDYEKCPVYSMNSHWQAKEQNIEIVIEDNYTDLTDHNCLVYGCRSVLGKVTFNSDDSSEIFAYFSEYDSRLYIGELLYEKTDDFGETILCYDTKNATEIWQCDYSQNIFTATVVSSMHYKKGEVLTFEKN